MYIKEPDNFMQCVRHVLSLPIRTRCAELAVLLDRGNLQELNTFFPILVDNIFGPQGTLSWGLRTTTENTPEDFRQLHHFLSPCGPIFNLIYALLKDPGIKYDFPLIYLPSKIRDFLESVQQHQFYSDLLHINPQTKKIVSLLLNPFDYYMFHFAYYLINPAHQRSVAALTSWNTVYYVLCCDYILHFLPTDSTKPILPEIYYTGKNPNSHIQQTVNPQQQQSGLFNKSAASVEETTYYKNVDNRHPRNEIWRSETVLTVFIDMWLHNDQIGHSADINNSFNTTAPMRLLQFNELPTGEYMRIVRVLIKQLHSFAASAKADDTYLCELKKVAIPMIQGKFYIFLRNLIHRWPLDGSFRLVLELWLTYIQPWRYLPNNILQRLNKKDTNPDVEDVSLAPNPSVERDYLPFIAENLLAYVVIFQQLLPRFCRVDLVSPKMSLMLYRITKVFDQPNLAQYLREIEQCVENNHSPTHNKYNTTWTSNLPPLSPTSNWSTNTNRIISPIAQNFTLNTTYNLTNSLNDKRWSAIIRQKIFELEGPNFCYKPLFSAQPATEVFSLLHQIKNSIVIAQEIVDTKEKEEAEMYGSFWNMFKSFFSATVSTDEFTINERKKVPIYLDVSLQNLKDIFNISDIQETEPDITSNVNTSAMESTTMYLTPERVKSRLKNIKYEGDPDLHPIRSTEITFLVRAFYHLATKINQEFGPQFYRSYHDPSYWGRVSRQILCAPAVVYKFDKSLPGSPRVPTNLPPRISLRYCASQKFVGYLIFGAILTLLFGYSISFYLLTLFFAFVLYKFLKAIPNDATQVRHNYPTEGFGNISFNDSF